MIQILEALVDTRVDTKVEKVLAKLRQSIINECNEKIHQALMREPKEPPSITRFFESKRSKDVEGSTTPEIKNNVENFINI